MNTTHSLAKQILLFILGIVIWFAGILALVFITIFNRLNWGLTLSKTVIILVAIDIIFFCILLFFHHLTSDKVVSKTTTVENKSNRLRKVATFISSLSLITHLGILYFGVSDFWNHPPELSKPTPSFVANIGQDRHVKAKSSERFLEGYVAQQGNGIFRIISSPIQESGIYSIGSEFNAECDVEQPSWGSRIKSSGRAPGNNPVQLRKGLLEARVHFPESPLISQPILIEGVLTIPCLYPMKKGQGFINTRGDVETESFSILIGPHGTFENAKTLYIKYRFAVIILVPTILFSAFFGYILMHVLGIKIL